MGDKDNSLGSIGDEKTTALAMPMPIRIMVGQTYRMVVDNHIAKVKVEKIYDDVNSKYIVVTIKKKGSFFSSTTTAITTDEFKKRIISGGYMELEI